MDEGIEGGLCRVGRGSFAKEGLQGTRVIARAVSRYIQDIAENS